MTDNDISEFKIHPQIRMLVAQLCEAFNIPMQESKLLIWQQKLGIPNTELLKQAYEQITDGKGVTLKMPTIAEFMQIYKEKESNFFKKQSLNLEQQYGNGKGKKKDTELAKHYIPILLNLMNEGKRAVGNLCDKPHDGIQDGRTFRLTRDVHGKDWCYYHDYSKNID